MKFSFLIILLFLTIPRAYSADPELVFLGKMMSCPLLASGVAFGVDYYNFKKNEKVPREMYPSDFKYSDGILWLGTAACLGAWLAYDLKDNIKNAVKPALKSVVKKSLRVIPFLGFLANPDNSIADDDYEAYYFKHPNQDPRRAASNLDKSDLDQPNSVFSVSGTTAVSAVAPN